MCGLFQTRAHGLHPPDNPTWDGYSPLPCNPFTLFHLCSNYVYICTYTNTSTMFHVEHISKLHTARPRKKKGAPQRAP
jgi:hypothetical protein